MAIIAPTTQGLELMQRYLDAFNRADWDAFKSCLAPDSVHIEPGGVEAHGPDATVEAVKVFRTAMPDLSGTVVRVAVGPDAAMSELVWRGTHTGPLATPTGTIAPTGRPVTVHACKVFAFEGDRITYGRHYWDLTELLGAIGALPAPG
jgi:steroid delta-isomerase-like uncharacterized protein